MAGYPPLFAKGKTNAKNITSQVIGSTDTALTLDNVTSLTTGMHVFTSDDAGAGSVEYLGKIKTIVGLVVTTQFRARFARVSGADFWTPTASWQAATVPGLGHQGRMLDPGIERLTTTAAQDMRTRVRDAREFVEFTWSNAVRTDLVAYQAWMLANTNNCLGTFTAAWFDAELGYNRNCKVQLHDVDRPQSSKDEAYLLRSWVRTVLVVTVDAYR